MTNQDAETALFLSFRYALGRKTYVVDEVCYLISKYRDLLNQQTKDKIKEEILRAIERNEAGMLCDIATWSKLKETL